MLRGLAVSIECIAHLGLSILLIIFAANANERQHSEVEIVVVPCIKDGKVKCPEDTARRLEWDSVR
jgi:hypothetical protein